jgi:hypothetical protein
MSTNDAALTIGLNIVRPTVVIDGTAYGLRSADEFSVVDYHRLGRRGRRLDVLMAKDDELTPEEEVELSSLMDMICRQILDAPDDVHAKLRDLHRLSICRTFTQLQGKSLGPDGAKTTGA